MKHRLRRWARSWDDELWDALLRLGWYYDAVLAVLVVVLVRTHHPVRW